jgi:cell division protein ZapE
MQPTSTSLRDAYRTLVQNGDLKANRAQEEAVEVLQLFANDLQKRQNARHQQHAGLWGQLGRLFADNAVSAKDKNGLYIYGKVGRGKSMLMDLFMEHVAVEPRRRVHFHQFMLEIHARLNKLRQSDDTDDIMRNLVRGIASETALLAFDEFHVNNIADAMILGRLFDELFRAGVAIVSTSNWAPDDLYKNGLQRDRFLPFIDLIKEKMTIHEIGGSTDYRFEQIRQLKSYFSPLGLETTRALQGIFLDLTHEAAPVQIVLPIEGRTLTIARAAQGVGFFNFDELCEQPLGAADYLALASCLHTVILDGVPAFKLDNRNAAVRFMTLIDTLYEAKAKLFMGSATPIDKFGTTEDMAYAFQRTISRLMEMQGEAYRVKAHLV